MTYNADQVEQLRKKYLEIEIQYEEIFLKFWALKFKKTDAAEYVVHGFMRRLGTLKRAIHNVYTLYPPDMANKPRKDELIDLTINLQSFIINVFGCFDNLAWAWVKEKELKNKKGNTLSGISVGIVSAKTHEIVRKSFSQEFQVYLDKLEPWFSYLEDYRHALAHRIPLYIPPFQITPESYKVYQALEVEMQAALKRLDFKKYGELEKEQQNLGQFVPVAVHSVIVSRPVRFHAQLIADWLTVVEVSEKFLREWA
jgi:hypothetical protein